MKIITIFGTRPEIIKFSPLLPLLDQEFEHKLIHTGQHYDYNMDLVFFEELQLRQPDYQLKIGSHTPGKQIAMMLEQIELILIQEKPDLVAVLGDTNSTLAGALAAAKLFIPLMHIESGCRSFSRELPEELNKTVVPHIADYCIAPDKICQQNLINAGIKNQKIFLLGSTVFDAVERNKKLVDTEKVLQKYGLQKDNFILLTMHRAENTDNLPRFRGMIQAINDVAEIKTIIFPLHPRTKKIMTENGIQLHQNIKIIEPESYLNFLALLSACRFCMSDSGGIQEEALAFNIPCLILRNVTEWTRLVEAGKNIVASTEPAKILAAALKLLDNSELDAIKNIQYPYETKVAERIIEVMKSSASHSLS